MSDTSGDVLIDWLIEMAGITPDLSRVDLQALSAGLAQPADRGGAGRDGAGASSPLTALPDEMISAILWQAANDADAGAAFYSLHSLLRTAYRIRSIGLAEKALRQRYGVLARETKDQRKARAEAEAGLPANVLTADELIDAHGLVDVEAVQQIRFLVAARDIVHRGLSAPEAIARDHGIDPARFHELRRRGAAADLKSGRSASEAIERQGIDDPAVERDIRHDAAWSDIEQGMPAPAALDRHGVVDPSQARQLRRRAADGDVLKGLPAPAILARQGITHDDDTIELGKVCAMRDLKVSRDIKHELPDILERNGVARDFSRNDVRKDAARWCIVQQKATPRKAWEDCGVGSTTDRRWLNFIAAARDICKSRIAPDKAIGTYKKSPGGLEAKHERDLRSSNRMPLTNAIRC